MHLIIMPVSSHVNKMTYTNQLGICMEVMSSNPPAMANTFIIQVMCNARYITQQNKRLNFDNQFVGKSLLF